LVDGRSNNACAVLVPGPVVSVPLFGPIRYGSIRAHYSMAAVGIVHDVVVAALERQCVWWGTVGCDR
jgi:hypothetical protein